MPKIEKPGAIALKGILDYVWALRYMHITQVDRYTKNPFQAIYHFPLNYPIKHAPQPQNPINAC